MSKRELPAPGVGLNPSDEPVDGLNRKPKLFLCDDNTLGALVMGLFGRRSTVNESVSFV